MSRHEITFPNKEGIRLSAKLELPAGGQRHGYAIFAHCFTCSKNLHAVRAISSALTLNGFGVLSFDFTGLGSSEGDFSDTNFSSNVDDLVYAAKFLEAEYEAPTLLIGHSLGGAAVLYASIQMPSVKAIATIGAPSNPAHVAHLFENSIDDIEASGEAKVNIGGRPFTIKKQLVDNLREHQLPEVMKGLRKSTLFLHSPQDTTVGIENAAALYAAAHHPKSFISLEGADHLLSRKADAIYAGNVIASWANRYIPLKDEEPLMSDAALVAKIGGKSSAFATQIQAGKHSFTADEPENVGGLDTGPSPYQLLMGALAACTVITLRMYADRKKWPLNEVLVHINHSTGHMDDCEKCEDTTGKTSKFERIIELTGQLDESQRGRLLEIANKCPVHKMLEAGAVVETKLQ
ncbi:MAG: alpha/beta fold hydrolase [Imperialibacter sp.]|uniref:bifunctional alpha/beta hydrolase/OsmC family protein n=1 Tax=Imperialibacter sp. TaxID=2038411 RepID=UPI003A8B9974